MADRQLSRTARVRVGLMQTGSEGCSRNKPRVSGRSRLAVTSEPAARR
jgi:hypothetical protein